MAAKTMDELLAQTKFTVRSFKRGQRIQAKLTEVGPSWANFDIGGKAEGVLVEVYFNESKDYLKTLKVGESVEATVINPETPDGRVLLSLRNAANDSIWFRLEDLKKEGKVVNVKILGISGNGLTAEFENVLGYIPQPNLGSAISEDLEALIDRHLEVKIIEVNKAKKRVVFSERAISEAESMQEQVNALGKVKEGEVYEGVITQNTSFGSFVEIEVEGTKIEGLVHVSELSWEKVSEPSAVVQPGDKIKVKVLALRDGKLALSAKQAQDDPWITIADKYKKDDKVQGTVVKQSDYGVFVQLEPGIEGLIHMTKIAPGTKLENGQEINVYIEEIDTQKKKISLGMVLTAKPVNYR